MEQPVARAIGHELDRHRAAGYQQPRVALSDRRSGEYCVRALSPAPLEVEVESVQMHWVGCGAGVDDTPLHLFTLGESETLGVRPRFPVEHQDLAPMRDPTRGAIRILA